MNNIPLPHPSAHDLNDWAFDNAPEAFEAVRYLPPSNQYALFLSLWHKAGRSVKGFESDLSFE